MESQEGQERIRRMTKSQVERFDRAKDVKEKVLEESHAK